MVELLLAVAVVAAFVVGISVGRATKKPEHIIEYRERVVRTPAREPAQWEVLFDSKPVTKTAAASEPTSEQDPEPVRRETAAPVSETEPDPPEPETEPDPPEPETGPDPSPWRKWNA
jgi:hypothetical protein